MFYPEFYVGLGSDGGYICTPDQGMLWSREHDQAYKSCGDKERIVSAGGRVTLHGHLEDQEARE